MKEYYETNRIDNALPIPDALDGVKKLKEMGFKLVVITARPHHERERSLLWVDNHFPGRHGSPSSQRCTITTCCPPGIFETVICTGQSQEGIFADGHEVITKLTKADVRTKSDHETINLPQPGYIQVCKEINAKVLIDDSAENAFKTASVPHPITVLLFGNYNWNRRLAKIKSEAEELSHEEKNKIENEREWWKDDEFELPQPGLRVHRTEDWEAVVEWVRKAKEDGHWE